jgi:signal transduction histidine kinase/CheY-like chemotaxis protein/GAF domain-containing protein
MPYSSRVKINIGLLLAVLLVLAAGLFAYLSADRAFSAAGSAAQSQAVLRSLDALTAAVQQAEAVQRGYILTGNPALRRGHDERDEQIRAELAALAALLRDDSAQREPLARVVELANRRMELLDVVLAAYDAGGFDAARAEVATGGGVTTMAALAGAIGEMQRIERARADRRRSQEVFSEKVSRNLLVLTAVLSLIMVAGAAYVINRDLTLRQRIEAELRRAMDAANEANRAKSEFLATVSHEIRTPLNAVLGMTELLREGKLSSEQHEFARSVQANAEMLVQMVGDLLDSFKIEAGQVDIEHVPFDARDLIESVGEILAVRAEAKELDLSVSVHPDVPPVVLGDPNRLRQIVMNLVGNAIKFTESGLVSLQALPDNVAAGRCDLRITVTDTGIGIAEENLERIFHPFVQADASTTRRFGGTGLGLSIASSLARLMGGAITVASEPGKGSAFTVTLPVTIDDSVSARPRPDVAGVDILAVIDDPARAEALGSRLRAAAAGVTLAHSGADALRLFEAGHFDLVIVDDRVRGHRSLIQRLKADRTASVAVVALCALSSTLTGEDAVEGTECVFKPVRETRLLDAVARAAGRRATAGGQRRDVSSSASSVPRHVLVVEDNRDNWNFISRALRGGGYVVDRAENGELGVEAARQRRYALILMDVEMPVMDGFRATEAIRAVERAERRAPTPVIALTAHASRGFRERCLASGMDEYATKPITGQRLLDIAAEWIDTRPLVLVADDAPENHVLVRHFLGAEGYRFVGANDGREALEVLQLEDVSAVLLDMDMPVLNGYDTVRRIRARAEWRDLPVIAMTGYSGAAEKEKCIAAGCSLYVEKPIRKAELALAMRKALQTIHVQRVTSTGSLAEPRGAAPGDRAALRDVSAEIQSRLSRIGRLLNRLDFDTALPIAVELREMLQRARAERGVRIARELQRALEDGEEQSAVFWVARLQSSLLETERLEALHRSGLLGSAPEEAFDRLTREVVERLHVPTAVVSFVDERRQVFKSAVGLGPELAKCMETPLSHSFCQHVVAAAEPLVVVDARQHPIVQNNLAVPDLGVIAYAGVPLRSADGFVLGSLCAIDSKPREWSAEDLRILDALASEAEREIERHAARLSGTTPEPTAVAEDGDDDPALAALARQFLETRHQEAAEQVDAWLAEGDLAQVARYGHQVKGSAATFGFPEIGELGASLERAANEGGGPQVTGAASALRAALVAALDRASPRGRG